MKRTLFFLFTVFTAVFCYAQDADQLIKEGVKLHDEGKYKEAIAKYDAAIAIDANAYLAYYEKVLSLMNDGQYNECIDLAKWTLKKFPDGPDNAGLYVSWGTCYDYLKKPEKAIDAYNEGLKKYPGAALLYYNKAITLYNTNKTEEAEAAIEQSILNNPVHGSSHQMMSLVNEKKNRMYSLLASLYFMAVEPTGKRAQSRLTITEELIGANVQKKDGGGVNITLAMPDDTKNKQPNNFQSLEMILSMSVALGLDEKFKEETKPEKMNRILTSVISLLKENKKDGSGFGWNFYAPFFITLKEKDYLEVYCHAMYASSGDEVNVKWIQDHSERVEEYWQWVNNYGKK